MVVKRAATLLALLLAITGCAQSESDPLAVPSSAPPDACTPGATFSTIKDYAAGSGPKDEVGGAETPEGAASTYAATMRPPGPSGGWTRVPDEGQEPRTALMAAEDYRLLAYTLKDSTWIASGGYRCASG